MTNGTAEIASRITAPVRYEPPPKSGPRLVWIAVIWLSGVAAGILLAASLI